MTTSAFSFISNIEIASTSTTGLYNSSEYSPYSSIGGISAGIPTTFFSRPYSDGMRELCGVVNTTDCVWGLLYTPSLWGSKPQCIDCLNYTCVSIIQESGGSTSGNCICLSDAYRKPDSELNWFQEAITCDDYSVPIEGYYWKQSNNKMTCYNFTICGEPSESIIEYEIDKILDEKGAKAYYPANLKNEDYKSTILIKCNNDYQPEITIFGIPIFSLQLWLGFFVLGLLFFFLNKIRRH